MKGLVCYYSGSGNTRMALEYIAGRMDNIDLELFDLVRDGAPDVDGYDMVAFACFTDFGGPPFLMQRFIEDLPAQRGKPSFVFNTYGFMSGRTLGSLAKQVTGKGFLVIGGHSLHTPENYPPMIVGGRGAEDRPNDGDMSKFDGFIRELDTAIGSHLSGQARFERGRVKRGLFMMSRTRARKVMGDKFVDGTLCTECGVCEKGCPYGAIKLDPRPVFDMGRCHGCWYCYNHCPQKAIYTSKFRGNGHYPRPVANVVARLRT